MNEPAPQQHRRYIKLFGALAVGGVGIGVVADFFSGWSGAPNAMETAISVSFDDIKALFLAKPRWTYVLGHYLAIFFLPFHIVGSYLVYLALKPAGVRAALIYFLPAVYFAVLGTGYHGTFAFVGDIIQSGDAALMRNMLDYWQGWGAILVAGYVVMSAYLLIRIALGGSIFPRWIAAFCPLSIMAMTTLVAFFLPDSLAGFRTFLVVTGLNLPLAVFYAIATRWLLRADSVDLRIP